jgi:alkanesulfonate monooxygenase SsuD/methylene tetrahydromethanopterin reductase-like flavin-dependent oxidoreductase (luciferase family)
MLLPALVLHMDAYKQVLDPLDALTYVAAQTKKIKLGTSVLDMPYHNPVVLARRLTTIDVLSNGRLWPDERPAQYTFHCSRGCSFRRS